MRTAAGGAAAGGDRGGAHPDVRHRLAAVYVGFTVTHGHYLIKWADGHARHRLGGGPRPPKPPRYGMSRAVHDWKMTARAVAGAAIAAALLQGAIRYVGDAQQADPLRMWQMWPGWISAISVIIGLSYTVSPKRTKGGAG